MSNRRLLSHLFPSYGAIAALAVLFVGWVALGQAEKTGLSAIQHELRASADFLDQQLGPEIPADRRDFVRMCRQFDQATLTRVTLLLADGKVDFDTDNRPDELEQQSRRAEIQAALEGTPRVETRYHAALDGRVMYQAVPVLRQDRVAGVLYLSRSLAPLDSALARMQALMLAVGVAAVCLAALLAWRASRGIARPLAELAHAEQRITSGELAARVAVPDARELADLAERFNRMAEVLQQRIGVLVQNNNEQKAVLASMAEGVLAVDTRERVISMNTAARRLLSLERTQAQGQPLREVVRNADLTRFVTRALVSAEPVQADVLLLGDRQRVMQAHGSALHDSENRAIGAVIVLNDVTDFRRLEHIRRDFVANVSHELKTPITSIKGFVETLLDGASQDPVDAERFLRIIAKQADRLHAIIEDLLSLSKIEQREDSEDIVLEAAPLGGVLDAAAQTCSAAAADRNVAVVVACDDNLRAEINPVLLEQAVVNLLDNAIKYSEAGREVRVTAVDGGDDVVIHVADRGYGIAEEHLSRIFERFYRVDRARSRKLGGTGLGLAIVKHIVQAHHGRVSVDSTLGVGSTFTIHLPKVAAEE